LKSNWCSGSTLPSNNWNAMATTPEGKVKNAVRKLLSDRGIWYYQPMQNGMGRVGIPDFICCWNGKFIAIETKAPGKKAALTANQQGVLWAIEAHGGRAVVVDDVNELSHYLACIPQDPQEESHD
jgi:hypothetical protein